MIFNHYNLYDPCNSGIRLTDSELIAIFPEAKQIIAALIKELAAKCEVLVLYIGKELAAIKAESQDEFYRYFWRLWLMLNAGEELQETERKLARLKRLQNVINGKPAPRGMLPDDMVASARAVPITDILDTPLKRSGKGYVCLCPLHDDHSPSMRVYVEQNRAWCYVCDDGGDTLRLYMLMNGFDFKTAVQELAGITK
jgi:hypothetical protein